MLPEGHFCRDVGSHLDVIQITPSRKDPPCLSLSRSPIGCQQFQRFSRSPGRLRPRLPSASLCAGVQPWPIGFLRIAIKPQSCVGPTIEFQGSPGTEELPTAVTRHRIFVNYHRTAALYRTGQETLRKSPQQNASDRSPVRGRMLNRSPAGAECVSPGRKPWEGFEIRSEFRRDGTTTSTAHRLQTRPRSSKSHTPQNRNCTPSTLASDSPRP